MTPTVHSIKLVLVSQLNLGHYQRHMTNKQKSQASLRVKQMVKKFDPNLWRPPIVSIRPTGDMFVVDGWHRVLLALALEWETIQVEVRTGLDYLEEADLFDRLNSGQVTKPTNPEAQYNAALEKADPFVVEIDKTVRDVGLELGRDLFCHAALRIVHGRCGVDTLRTTLMVLKDVAEERPIQAWLVKNVAEVVHKAGWRLDPDLLHTIVMTRYGEIEKQRSTAPENRTKAANFIVRVYNHGRPNNQRIPRVA